MQKHLDPQTTDLKMPKQISLRQARLARRSFVNRLAITALSPSALSLLPLLKVESSFADTLSAPTANLPQAFSSYSSEVVAAHLLNRLGFGPRPGDLEKVALSPVAWLNAQLLPSTLPLPTTLTAKLNESAFLKADPMEVVREFRERQREQNQNLNVQTAAAAPGQAPAQGEGLGIPAQPVNPAPPINPLGRYVNSVARPAMESRLLRALESPRQLEEVLVDFWFNHFNVFQGKNILRVMMGHYEHYAIRPFAMGHFRDLLGATARHPAMLTTWTMRKAWQIREEVAD